MEKNLNLIGISETNSDCEDNFFPNETEELQDNFSLKKDDEYKQFFSILENSNFHTKNKNEEMNDSIESENFNQIPSPQTRHRINVFNNNIKNFPKFNLQPFNLNSNPNYIQNNNSNFNQNNYNNNNLSNYPTAYSNRANPACTNNNKNNNNNNNMNVNTMGNTNIINFPDNPYSNEHSPQVSGNINLNSNNNNMLNEQLIMQKLMLSNEDYENSANSNSIFNQSIQSNLSLLRNLNLNQYRRKSLDCCNNNLLNQELFKLSPKKFSKEPRKSFLVTDSLKNKNYFNIINLMPIPMENCENEFYNTDDDDSSIFNTNININPNNMNCNTANTCINFNKQNLNQSYNYANGIRANFLNLSLGLDAHSDNSNSINNSFNCKNNSINFNNNKNNILFGSSNINNNNNNNRNNHNSCNTQNCMHPQINSFPSNVINLPQEFPSPPTSKRVHNSFNMNQPYSINMNPNMINNRNNHLFTSSNKSVNNFISNNPIFAAISKNNNINNSSNNNSVSYQNVHYNSQHNNSCISNNNIPTKNIYQQTPLGLGNLAIHNANSNLYAQMKKNSKKDNRNSNNNNNKLILQNLNKSRNSFLSPKKLGNMNQQPYEFINNPSGNSLINSNINNNNNNFTINNLASNVNTSTVNISEEKHLPDNFFVYLKDQNGCRLIQKKIEQKNYDFIMIFYEKVINSKNLSEIVNDQFGNYVIQKFLEIVYKDKSIMTVFYDNIADKLYDISVNQYGTRVLQKSLDLLEKSYHLIENEANNKVFKLLIVSHIMDLIVDMNGNHVLMKIIGLFPKDKNEFIYQLLCEKCLEICKLKQGGSVLQKAFDQATPKQRVKLLLFQIFNLKN